MNEILTKPNSMRRNEYKIRQNLVPLIGKSLKFFSFFSGNFAIQQSLKEERTGEVTVLFSP